jgi:hypothetical protein
MPKKLDNRKLTTPARSEYERLANLSDKLVAEASRLLAQAKVARDQAEAIPIGGQE